jgi:hypothetical protein
VDRTEVVTDALRDEGRKWFALSAEMHKVAGSIGGLNLDDSAFWCGDQISVAPAGIYRDFQQFVRDRCGEGADEFEQVGEALNRAADEYDGSDEVAAETLTKIYGNL